jgi:RNA recognition motif-containing protein
MNIYISNLRSAINNEELTKIFSAYGEVRSAEIAMDVFTGKSRGFGYVEMDDNEAAQRAIDGLNNTELGELVITVEEAKTKAGSKISWELGDEHIQGYQFRKN